MAIFGKRPSNVLAAALALAALASAPVAGQSRSVETRTGGAHALGRSRPAGCVVDRHDYALRTARGACRQAGADGGRSGRNREDEPATNNQDRRDGAGTDADLARAYNDFWWDRGTKVVSTRQTSLVVDPPDGRVPALTAEGQKRATERAARGYDSWQDRSLWERCITRGLPMIPGPYNNNYQILQTPGYVVILHEMIHDARIIPLDGQPHIGRNIRQWFGDSRGKWEGDTLVVDTTNFTDKANYRGSTDGLHLIERFTRINADTVRYEFTIDDPTTFTKRWTTSIPMQHTDEQIYEYACHEGNYGMVNLLSGARAQEKAAEGK